MQNSPSSTEQSVADMGIEAPIDRVNDKYPFCIVWTPLPLITWFLPFIGHMGIAMSNGVIRDFGGPYYVAEDNFTFGRPTKYWRLDPRKCSGGVFGWDSGVREASEIYSKRMHNICCDNCHSHVAMALNKMGYKDSARWNMVYLAVLMLCCSRYVSFWGLLKTWGPFSVMAVITIVLYFSL